MDYQLGPGPLQVDQNTIDEKIKGDIGIVENGDVATHAIPNGYYVIWKGDLYVAKTSISSGTTLSAESNGNLTAKPNGLGGEVASLNSNFTPSYVLNKISPSSGSPGIQVSKVGKVLSFKIFFVTNEAIGQYTTIMYFPDGISFATGGVFEIVDSSHNYVGNAYADARGNGINAFTTLAANTNYIISGVLLLL